MHLSDTAYILHWVVTLQSHSLKLANLTNREKIHVKLQGGRSYWFEHISMSVPRGLDVFFLLPELKLLVFYGALCPAQGV